MAVLEALKSNPILQGQTSQAQRLQYLWLSFWSTSGMASLIYFIIPIVFLWTGMTPVPSFDPTFFTWFLPYLVVGWLSRIAAFPADQRRHAWRAERQKEAQFFQSIQAVIQFLKGIVPYRETATQLSVGPQAVLFLLTLSSMIAGTLRFWQGGSVSGYALTFGLLWAMYNLALLSISPPGVDFSFLRQEQDPTQSDPVEAGQ
jgi:cellulose synthase (UDP-forming)